MRGAWLLAVAIVLLLAESSALASPVFPDAIQRHLGLTYSPPCSLCHAGSVTGLGTVITPFGNAMRVRGLVARDIASLGMALDRMASDQVDSNGNGVSDIDELKAGTDRNAGVPGAVSPPEFGCRAARGHDDLPPWSAAWLAAAAALIRAPRGTTRSTRRPLGSATRSGAPRRRRHTPGRGHGGWHVRGPRRRVRPRSARR